ncbi:MAG: hypothetical protein M3R01_11995, partial [Actinomycetota bacterium]|nr:hypothetical protein [Actinomycetota bacterium]
MYPTAASGLGLTEMAPAGEAVDVGLAGGSASPHQRPPGSEREQSRRRARSLLLAVVLLGLLAVPLVVALVALRQPRWYPVLDMAQTELRVRDVSSADPPLIGLAGRIGKLGQQGSHPGPFSFWA